MNLKKFWIAFIITALAGILTCMGIIVYVDPFFHYHAPLKNFPYVVDNQVDMNPGLARHMDYDSVLLGSSMTVSFDTSWFMEELGLKTQKLSYNGAYPKDQSNIMKIIFESKPNVKTVFLGIDELNYSAEPAITKYPITKHLYDKNPFNDVQYLLNKEVLLDYVLKPMVDTKDKSDWNMIYKMWWQPIHYNLANIRLYYTPAEEIPDTTPIEEYIAGIERNLEENIVPYIKNNPNTEFVIFYPPYSILYWYDAKRQDRIDTILEKYDYMTRRLLEYDNVEIHFFQNDENIITNFDNYADYTHYSPEVCHYIVKCFKDKSHKVTLENLDSQLKILDVLAKDYDYGSIDL